MEPESTKNGHCHKHCWISPEDALDYLNSACKFGENDKPIQITECFLVWGRGRPRPRVDQIILPKGTTLQSNFPQERLTKGRGRGYLLLENSTFDDNDLEPGPSVYMFKPNLVQCDAKPIDKNSKKLRKGKGHQTKVDCQQMTLKDLEEKYNSKYLGIQKPLFDINDFPPLQ